MERKQTQNYSLNYRLKSKDWDPDEYLHQSLQIYLRKHSLPLQPKNVLKDSEDHQVMYRTLRKELWEYENNGGASPALVPLHGGKEWIWKQGITEIKRQNSYRT